jgi:hypothetical protein
LPESGFAERETRTAALLLKAVDFKSSSQFYRCQKSRINSRVSHNLGCLLNCRFVKWEWQGKNKVYRLHRYLLPILNAIDKHPARYTPALESCKCLKLKTSRFSLRLLFTAIPFCAGGVANPSEERDEGQSVHHRGLSIRSTRCSM